jgi:hypothetical protein
MADSDSENEGILNNIQRLVIRPPGHTGKAKKGHICFDGGYETMNLGRVDFITNQEYDLFIRPDTANPRARYCCCGFEVDTPSTVINDPANRNGKYFRHKINSSIVCTNNKQFYHYFRLGSGSTSRWRTHKKTSE